MKRRKEVQLRWCECGRCGLVTTVRQGKAMRFISGHNGDKKVLVAKMAKAASVANAGENNPAKRPEVRAILSQVHSGVKLSNEHRLAIKKSLTNNSKIKARGNYCNRKGTSTSPKARQNLSIGASNRILNCKTNGLLWSECGIVTLERLGLTTHYRSSYEKKVLLLLDECVTVVSVAVEALRIEYSDNNSIVRNYIPDFLVVLTNDITGLIEVKPKYMIREAAKKIEAGMKYAQKHNMFFQVWTEDVVFEKVSVTTMFEQVIARATATVPMGRRDSLNQLVTVGGEQK